MTQAALTPMSSTQQDAVAWLKNYGESFGDFAPNSIDVALSASTKTEVYDDYTKDMLSFGECFISFKVFDELWRVIYPHYKLREWCSIPGKCDTCGEINRLRRTSTISAVREAAKQAHALHRGGFFMLERQQYVLIWLP
jgi:hypothetical protein